MTQTEMTVSDFGLTEEAAKEKYGLLSRYTFYWTPEAVEESHSLTLWSAHFAASVGYMWVHYSQEAIDSNGDVCSGCWNVPSIWILEKDSGGEWFVSHIKERP